MASSNRRFASGGVSVPLPLKSLDTESRSSDSSKPKLGEEPDGCRFEAERSTERVMVAVAVGDCNYHVLCFKLFPWFFSHSLKFIPTDPTSFLPLPQ